MDTNQIKSAIELCLKRGIAAEITYHTYTTRVNKGFITPMIGKCELSSPITEYDLNQFTESLNDAVSQLKTSYPDLHIISKKVELHFYYSGFNSCSTKNLPVLVSNEKEEVKKTGVVTEKYTLVGKSKVMSVIASHPDYELYKRSGFGFRGAQERRCTYDEMMKMCDWMACADIEVIDNEIHVNGFSSNDMY